MVEFKDNSAWLMPCIHELINMHSLDTMTMHQAASCRTGATTCHSKASCVDYEIGFCCSCKQGYFGNGKSCQPNGEPFISAGCARFRRKIRVRVSRDKLELMACKRAAFEVLSKKGTGRAKDGGGLKKGSLSQFSVPLATLEDAPSNADKGTQKSSRGK